MVSQLMSAWLTDVFVPNTAPGADGLRHLYIDNMGAHETPAVQIQLMEDSDIRFHPLPPNCSHLLQPLDHSLNATVKYVYRLLHSRWLLRLIEQGTVATVTRRDPAPEQVTEASLVKRRSRPKRKLLFQEEQDEEEDREGEGAEGFEGETRTRGPRKDEVEERIVVSVYALSKTNVLHSWEHTLNGTSAIAAAVTGHNQRETDGCLVTNSRRRRRGRNCDDTLAQQQLEEMLQQMEEEEQMAVSGLRDDLQVVGNWELNTAQ